MIHRLGARLIILVALLASLVTLVGADPYLRVDLGQDRNGTIWRGNSRPRLSYPVPDPGNTSLGGLEYLRVVDAKSLVPDDYEVEVNGGNATLRLASGPAIDTEALGTPLVGNGLSVMLNGFASDGDQWAFTAYNISGDNLLPWHPLHPGDPFFLSIGDFDAAGDGLQNEQLYPSDIWGQFTGGDPRVRLELVQPGMVPTSTPPRRHLTATADANVLMSLVNTNNVITPTSPEHPVTHQAMPWFVRFLDTPAGDEHENAYVLLYPTPGGTGPHGLGYEYAGIGSIWETDTHAGATYDNDQFVSVRVDNTTGALWEPDLALYTELVDPADPGFANLSPADLNGELPAWFSGPDTQAWEPVVYNVTLTMLIPGLPPFIPDIFVYTATGSDGYMWMDMFFDPGGLSYGNTNLIPGVTVNLDLNAPMGASAHVYVNEVSFMVRDRGAAATLWPTG